MPDMVKETILDNMRSTLAAVTVANGYANTIQTVQRWEADGNVLAPNKTAIILDPIDEEREDQPNPYCTKKLRVSVDLFLLHTKAEDNRESDKILVSLEGDIEKALMVDPTRGGNAIDTTIEGSNRFETMEGEGYTGTSFAVVILYRHRIDDPTAKA